MINKLAYGQFFSQFGSSLLNIAIILWVKETFNSATYITLIFLLTTTSVAITSLFAGPVIDNKKKVNLIASVDSMGFIFSLIAFLYIYLFSPTNYLILISLLILRVFLSVLYSFRGPSISAYIAEEIEVDNRQKTNSKIFTITTLAFIISESFSGIIYSKFGLIPLILLDAITYGIAVLFIFQNIDFSKILLKKKEDQKNKPYLQRSKEGWSYILQQKGLLYTTLVIFFISFFFSPYVVWMPFIIEDVYKLPTLWFGYATGATSFGVFTGGYISRYIKDEKRFIFAFFSLLCISLSFGLISYFRSGFLLIFLMFLSGVCLSIFNVMLSTVLQNKTDSEMHGRIFTSINAMTIIARPLGKASSGFALNIFNNNAAYCFGASSIFIFLGVILFFNREKVKSLYQY